MHFIGMLAFPWPVRVDYNVLLTVLSMAPAGLASSIMLHVMRQERIRPLSATPLLGTVL